MAACDDIIKLQGEKIAELEALQKNTLENVRFWENAATKYQIRAELAEDKYRSLLNKLTESFDKLEKLSKK